MKFIAWAFVFVVALLCRGATAQKPIMTVNGNSANEASIQEGDPLEFTCTGVGGNVSITRMHIFDNETVAKTYESEYTPTTEDSGVMVWQISAAKSGDTGWYSCAYANTTVINNEQILDHTHDNIDWTYVYVNSSTKFAVQNQPTTPFIPVYVPEESREIVVPCRVTSPDFDDKVRLEIRYPNIKNDLEGKEPVYHRKVGFVMHNFGYKWYNRNVECFIDGSVEDKVSYLFREPPPELPEPSIDADIYTQNSVLGRSLTLICNSSMETGGRVDYLSWTVPSASRNGMVGSHHDCRRLPTCESKLVLPNLTKNDAGEYICTAGSHAGAKQDSQKVDIKIWDGPQLNCTPEKERININATGDPMWARLIVSSERLDFKWYKLGNKDELLSKNPSKFKISQDHQKPKRIFEIHNASVTDTGNYTMLVKTSNLKCEYNLRLVVHGKPNVVVKSLSMENSLTHHKPRINATFTCIATAWPMPNVTWTFTEWRPETDKPKILHLTASNQHENETFSSVESRLTMNMEMTGHLTCEACNNVSCTADTQSILISDGNGTIGILDPGPVTEHDDLTLICFATHLNYTGPLVWYKNDDELYPNRTRIEESKDHHWTIRSELHIPNVSKEEDNGIYKCQALQAKNNTNFTTATHNLMVSAGSPLIFTHETTLKNETVVGTSSTGLREFKCFVTGRPVPRVTWYKDNEPLSQNPTGDSDDSCYKLIDNSTLKINVTALTSNSNFSCVAENRIARIESYTYFIVEGNGITGSTQVVMISLICVLIAVIIAVITCMGIKIHRERMNKRELSEAGLTHFEEGALECLNPDLTVDDQADLLPYNKKWEFPREHLKLGKQLGSGAFGVVMKAEARGICVEDKVTTVAVKMVRRTADLTYIKALSSELKIMTHLGKHLNVVNLLGACTKDILAKRELYVIVEYCRFGNLHNYLQRQRSSFIDQINPATGEIDFSVGQDRFNRSISIRSQNRSELMSVRSISLNSNGGTEMNDYRQGTDFVDINMSPDGGVLSNNSVQPGWRSNYRGDYNDQNLKPICTQDLLCWAWQVSRGMEYLSSRNVLHGDLAARNILLAEDNIVKICDFGLAKNMYKDNNYKKKGDGPLPIKWMAVESIRDRIFSTQSDVWSFGIVMWEFFTLAQTPYPSMEPADQYKKLLEGYRMEKPEYATHEIYDLMVHCWKGKPSLRPSFPELAESIGALLDDNLKGRYAALDTPYLNMNSEALANGQSDYLIMMSAPNHDQCNASNQALEAVPGYVPMSPIVKVDDPRIFSPRPDYQETEFRLYPPTDNVANDSNSQDRIETAAAEVERDPAEGCDVGDSPDLDNQSSEDETNLNDTSTAKNIKNKDLFPPTSGHQNYVNMSETAPEPKDLSTTISIDPEDLIPPIIQNQNYTNMPKKDSHPLVNGISNPNYTIMSVLNELK